MPWREHLSLIRLSVEQLALCGSISDFCISEKTANHRGSALCWPASRCENQLCAVTSWPSVHPKHSDAIERALFAHSPLFKNSNLKWWYQRMWCIRNISLPLREHFCVQNASPGSATGLTKQLSHSILSNHCRKSASLAVGMNKFVLSNAASPALS
jgi:hypothetical protein